MAAVAWTLSLYVVIAGAVATPFVVVGIRRMREGRTVLGRVLVTWGTLVVLVPVATTCLAYAFGLREPTTTDRGEAWPTWVLVFPPSAAIMLGGSLVWFMAWVVAWGVRPEAERPAATLHPPQESR